MGIYSELILGVQLKSTTPKIVIETLEYLCGKDGRFGYPEDFVTPDHPFFKSEKAESIFAYMQNSFDSIPGSSITTHDHYRKGYFLTVRAHLKNYDLEYEEFLDWIAPYCQTGENILTYIGYIHIEDRYTPHLIFIFKSQIWMAEITTPSRDDEGYEVTLAHMEDVVPGELLDQLKITGFITLKDYIERVHG